MMDTKINEFGRSGGFRISLSLKSQFYVDKDILLSCCSEICMLKG